MKGSSTQKVGRGSIEKRGAGYRITIHMGYDGDGKPLRHRETLSTLKAAQDTLRARLEEIETEGRLSERTKLNVESYVLKWLERVKAKHVAPRTLELYVKTAKRHLVGSKLGKLPMVVAKADDIEEHYEHMQKGTNNGRKAVKAPTVLLLNLLIKGAFKRAARRKHVVQSPCLCLDTLPQRQPKQTPPLEIEDFDRFIEAVSADPMGPFWLTLLTTGMRPAEALGLKWTDQRGREVTISRNLLRPYESKSVNEPWWTGPVARWWLGPTKTKRPRQVSLHPDLVNILKQHRARQLEQRLAAGPAYTDHGFIFADEVGEPLVYKRLAHAFPRILQRAGLDKLTIEELQVYSLRVGAATALRRRGGTLEMVADVLGHSNLQTTRRYAHVKEDERERASDMLGSVMNLRRV